MNQSAGKPINLAKLPKLLRQLRKKHRLSLNQLARATGLSRQTLARIESGRWGPIHPERSRRAGRTAFRLARALLGEQHTQRLLDDSSRLSRSLANDPDPLLRLLDHLYYFPAFLFHDSPQQRVLRKRFGRDYRHSLDLLLRSGFGTRNLGARLRAFRLRHDLTLVETAGLLGLSKSQLHRLERAERQPSPRARYRILRLLTLPLAGQGFSPADPEPLPSPRGKRAAPLLSVAEGPRRGQPAGRVGTQVPLNQGVGSGRGRARDIGATHANTASPPSKPLSPCRLPTLPLCDPLTLTLFFIASATSGSLAPPKAAAPTSRPATSPPSSASPSPISSASSAAIAPPAAPSATPSSASSPNRFLPSETTPAPLETFDFSSAESVCLGFA